MEEQRSTIPVTFHSSVPKGEFVKTNINGVPGYIFHDKEDAERILFKKEQQRRGWVAFVGLCIFLIPIVIMLTLFVKCEPSPVSTPTPTATLFPDAWYATPTPTPTLVPTKTPWPTPEPTPTREPTPTPVKTESICTTSPEYLDRNTKDALHALFQDIRIDSGATGAGISSKYLGGHNRTFNQAIEEIKEALNEKNRPRWYPEYNKFIAPTPYYPTWTLESWKFDSRTEECAEEAKRILGIN